VLASELATGAKGITEEIRRLSEELEKATPLSVIEVLV